MGARPCLGAGAGGARGTEPAAGGGGWCEDGGGRRSFLHSGVGVGRGSRAQLLGGRRGLRPNVNLIPVLPHFSLCFYVILLCFCGVILLCFCVILLCFSPSSFRQGGGVKRKEKPSVRTRGRCGRNKFSDEFFKLHNFRAKRDSPEMCTVPQEQYLPLPATQLEEKEIVSAWLDFS